MHPVDHRNRFAGAGQMDRVEGLRQQLALSREEQIPVRSIRGIGGGEIDDCLPSLAVERADEHTVVFGDIAVSEVEKVVSIGQELGPDVTPFVRTCHGCDRGRRSTCGGDAKERALTIGSEHDDAVAIPRAPSRVGGVTHGARASTVNRNRPELAIRKESQSIACRRPERECRVLSVRQRSGCCIVDRPHPQKRCATRARSRRGRERQLTAIR